MSDNENNGLTIEQKKKAINLEDLIYVKKYIKHNQKLFEDAMNANYEQFIQEEKQGITEAATQVINEYTYNKNDADERFYKKSDTVANAENATNSTNAENATNSTNATNAVPTDRGTYRGLLYEEDNHLLKFGANIINNKKVIWQGSQNVYAGGTTIDLGAALLSSNTKIMFDYIIGSFETNDYDVEKESAIFKAPINNRAYVEHQTIDSIIIPSTNSDGSIYTSVIECALCFNITSAQQIFFKTYGTSPQIYKFTITKIYTVLG